MRIFNQFSLIADQQIGTLLYRDIQYAFFDFLDKILRDCELNPGIGRVPLKWEQPVYGDRVPNFTDFAAPGVILSNENRFFFHPACRIKNNKISLLQQ